MTARAVLPARVRRLVLAGAVLAVLAVLGVGASPAAAGGWWSTPQLEHETPALAIGETTRVSASVLFDSTADAEAAAEAGDFHAVLVRGVDEAAMQAAMAEGRRDGWWTRPDEVIRLGPVTFGRNDANRGSASARFVVPDVAPGVYDVMLCDADCSEPLADIVPLRSVYVGELLAVRLMRESRTAADGLFYEVVQVHETLADVDATVRDLTGQVDGIDERLDETASVVASLATSVPAAPAPPAATTAVGRDAVWAGGGWFLAGVALAVAWSRRRGVTPDDLVPSPAEDPRDADEDGSAELPAPEFVTSLEGSGAR